MGKIIKNTFRGINLWTSSVLAVILLVAATTSFSATNPLIHSSDNLGTKYGSWGTSFSCATCHGPNTSNIKRIKQQITTPNGGVRSVVFTRMTANSNDTAGVFGNDSRTYLVNTSTNICEVCHSKTVYHRYSSTSNAVADKNHRSANGKDCTQCHSHQAAFKGSGHGFPFQGSLHKIGLTPPNYATASPVCTDCHNVTTAGGTYPSAPGTAPFCSGCHTNMTNFTSSGPSTAGCADCHGANSTNGTLNGRPTGASFPDIAGSHNAAGHIVQPCTNCHNNAGSGASDHGSQNHVAKVRADVTLSFSGNAVPADTNFVPAWNGSIDLTCMNIKCHDAGTGSFIETPQWGSVVPMCTACHNSRPTTGSHTHHLESPNINCNVCHKGAVEGATYPALHANDVIDVYNTTANTGSGRSDLGYPSAKTKGSSYDSCNTAFCHVDPSSVSGGPGTVPSQKITDTWGTSSVCNSCHLTRPTTGSHTAHYNAGFSAACDKCHVGAVENTTVPTTHNNNKIDVGVTVSGDLGYNGGSIGKSYGSAYSNCTTGSCHEDGRGNFVSSPTWGTANNDCSACHANLPTTGTHVSHVTTIGLSCGNCHKGASRGTTAPSTHNNGVIDVMVSTAGDMGYPAAKTKNTAYSSCTTVLCHGRLSPTWGTNTSSYQCTKCHGKATLLANYSTHSYAQSAPGYGGVGLNIAHITGTITGNVSSDPKVGAHDSHLRSLNNLGYPVQCSDCHTVPAVASPGPTHMNGSSLPTFSNKVQNKETVTDSGIPYTFAAGAIISNYDATTRQCSNIYCHGATLPGGSNTAPIWNDGSYFTGAPTDCGKCHGNPPTTGRFPHDGVVANTCSTTSCHPHNGSRTSTDPLLGNDFHINGSLEANKHCDTCHDYDTRGATGLVWGKNQIAIEGYGAHAMHINYLKKRMSITSMSANNDVFGTANFNGICGVCHSRHESDHTQSNRLTSTRSIIFGNMTARAARQFGSSLPTYGGVTGTSSSVNPKTCANVDCHYKKSPVWNPY